MPALRQILPLLGILLLTPQAPASEPQLALRDLSGVLHRLGDYRGKWVVVNYWATWCPPCLEEIPELVMLHENHKDHDLVVLGVNRERISRERLRAFVEEQFITYPVLPSPPGQATPVGRIPGLPTTYLIDPRGRLAARQLGPITAKGIEAYLRDYRSPR